MVRKIFDKAQQKPIGLNDSFDKILFALEGDALAQTPMAQYGRHVEKKFGLSFSQETSASRYNVEYYNNLHQWSVENLEKFWPDFIEYSGIDIDFGDGPVFEEIDLPPYGRYFPTAKFSYAENILKYWIENPDEMAFVYRHQVGDDNPENDRIITGQELCEQVSRWEQALRAAGVGEGDVLGMYVDNAPDAEFAAIAAANLGASMCSAGADLKAQAVISRFEDNKPKVLIATEGTVFSKYTTDNRPEIARVQTVLDSVEKTILLPAPGNDKADVSNLQNTVAVDRFVAPYVPKQLTFPKRSFETVGLLINSSGSTGKPKTFKHGYAGSLIEHAVEHDLYMGLKKGGRVACETTKSWMVSNAMKTSVLRNGSTVLSFDGDQFYGDQKKDAVAKLCADYKATQICTSAAAHNLRMSKARPDQEHLDLSSVQTIIYTGGVLNPAAQEELQDYYGRSLKTENPAHICSWAGGGDINGGFFAGTNMLPQHAGHSGVPILGKDIKILNAKTGYEVPYGKEGDLVCCSIPISAPYALVGDDVYHSKQHNEYYSQNEALCLPRQYWFHGDQVKFGIDYNVLYDGRTDEMHNQNDIKVSPQQLKVLIDSVDGAKETLGDFVTVNFKRSDNDRLLTVLLYTGTLPQDVHKEINTAINGTIGRGSAPAEHDQVPEIPITKSGKLVNILLGKILVGKVAECPPDMDVDTFEAFKEVGYALRIKYAAEPDIRTRLDQ